MWHNEYSERKEKGLSRYTLYQNKPFNLVGEDGFEPSKSLTTDLQSAPFGHSGTPPYESAIRPAL